MKLAYLKEADQEEVAHTVREVLRDRGARITEHTRSHTRFAGVRDDESGFTKGGYVGTYQHVGEREMQLRFDVEATVTARMLRRTIAIELLVVVLLLVWNPTPNTWVVAGTLLWIVLAATAILHLHTRRSSNRLEETLLEETLDELHHHTTKALRQEEQELQDLEEELEAQVMRERLEAKRKSARMEKATSTLSSITQSASRAAAKVRDAVIPDEGEATTPSGARDEPADEPPADEGDQTRQREALLKRIRTLRERVATARAEEDEEGGTDEEAERQAKLQRIRELREAIQERKRELDEDA